MEIIPFLSDFLFDIPDRLLFVIEASLKFECQISNYFICLTLKYYSYSHAGSKIDTCHKRPTNIWSPVRGILKLGIIWDKTTGWPGCSDSAFTSFILFSKDFRGGKKSNKWLVEMFSDLPQRQIMKKKQKLCTWLFLFLDIMIRLMIFQLSGYIKPVIWNSVTCFFSWYKQKRSLNGGGKRRGFDHKIKVKNNCPDLRPIFQQPWQS